MRLFALVALVFVVATPGSAHADLTLPTVFGDRMVLQCDMPVPIWGICRPSERVTVEFAGQTKTTTADAAGVWRVKLDALTISAESRDLTIRTDAERRVITDVVVGEVWLASGQSNMGATVSGAHNGAEALAAADDPLLRFFTTQKATAAEPQSQLTGKWERSDPATAKNFSAVAYFFARELRTRRGCPIGILHASWGGTPAQAWLSMDALRRDPPFVGYVKSWDSAVLKHGEVLIHPELVSAYQADLKRWQAEVAPAYQAALKQYQASKSRGPKPQPERPEPVNPDPMAIPSPSARPSTPSVIFNAMIAPLATYAMRGVIWYQGEANGGAGLEYRSLLPRLIGDWRAHWKQGDFPFLVVQLAGWDFDPRPAELHAWPWLREAQSRTVAAVPATAIAVTIDIGDPADVHPRDKLDVGLRLALAARRTAYGEEIVHCGPTFREATVEGSRIVVRFDQSGGGLTAGQSPWYAPNVEPYPLDRLIGFQIAGEDRVWHEAAANVAGDTVIVASPAVPKPVAVRYGWANSPRCNLYNREGLPASPFRSDDWPLPAAGPKP